ncbi:MAG TPA: DNA translocase FtsK [Spirochaetia bacterium]|nr:DNA translocase FtsK [Spirochaetia bacterium]HRZ64413.1 DNA translocase FtsK [Spirochaetia bacterium]
MLEAEQTSKANRVLAAALASAALLCLASLAAAGSGADLPPAITALGSFLLGSFSWACLFVPAWLAAAALLAFMPGYRPAAQVALAGSLLPFLPVAAFARLSSDPAALEALPFLEAAGLPAFGVGAFALALSLAAGVARLALAASRRRLPPEEEGPVERERGKRPGLLLPPPADRAEEAEEASAAGRRPPEAEELDPDPVLGPTPALGTGAPFVFRVPELAPLPPLRVLGSEAATDPDSLDAAEPDEGVEELPGADPGSPSEPEPGAEPLAASLAASVPREPPARAAVLRDPAASREPSAAREHAGAGEVAAKAEEASILELEGAPPIEFTSVPPAPPSASEEAEKEAAIKRILARRKDKPYAVSAEGILNAYPDGQYWIIDDKTRKSAEVLRDTLAEFNIEAEVTGIRKGPVITMFEILPAPGVKLSKITNLADNIALRLAASSVRIVAPIPGKHAVGIEVPNERRSIVSLREIVENESFKTAKMEVPVILGKDIAGEVQFIDLVQTPHLLIAGATGSGKSVCVNSIILSVLFRRSPEEVKLLLIDPKIVELKLYNDIPHLLTPVITEPKRAFQALQYCICEMERRYSMLDRVGVRDVKSYNRKVKEKGLAQERLPYIVVIIDEFADLMATTGKELESTLARLAAMSRAVGIHLVLATQRPSIDVITGLIKANIPSRIAFMVAGKFDSRIIIDMVGAEKLLGRGDMLFASAWDPFPIRMQGAYVSDEEVERAVEFVKTLGEPDYIDEEIFIDDEDEEGEPSLFGDEDDDPLFEKALEIVLQQGKASASYIQRRLKIGYNRASRLVELMEEKGIVGPAKGSKPRDLVHNPEVLGAARGAASPNARPAEAGRQPSLLPGLETVPGQRVTGKDEDE